MKYIIETAVLLVAEGFAILFRDFVATIINQNFGTSQMAIDTGYHFRLAMQAVDIAWGMIAAAMLIMYVVLIIYQIKKENEK